MSLSCMSLQLSDFRRYTVTLIAEMRQRIAAIDDDYESTRAEVHHWSSYRDSGAEEHGKQVL